MPFFNLGPLIRRNIGYISIFYFTFKDRHGTNFTFSIHAVTASRATRICFDEVMSVAGTSFLKVPILFATNAAFSHTSHKQLDYGMSLL